MLDFAPRNTRVSTVVHNLAALPGKVVLHNLGLPPSQPAFERGLANLTWVISRYYVDAGYLQLFIAATVL